MTETPATSAQPAIRLRGLRKTFGDVVAVDSVDLDIADGEFLTLLGPSGSGKTTVLRMIAGFELPTLGDQRTELVLMHARPRVGDQVLESGVGERRAFAKPFDLLGAFAPILFDDHPIEGMLYGEFPS